MQEWDRLVMIAIGAGVAIWTGKQGWPLWKAGNTTGVVGVLLLILSAIAVPLVLALFAT